MVSTAQTCQWSLPGGLQKGCDSQDISVWGRQLGAPWKTRYTERCLNAHINPFPVFCRALLPAQAICIHPLLPGTFLMSYFALQVEVRELG